MGKCESPNTDWMTLDIFHGRAAGEPQEEHPEDFDRLTGALIHAATAAHFCQPADADPETVGWYVRNWLSSTRGITPKEAGRVPVTEIIAQLTGDVEPPSGAPGRKPTTALAARHYLQWMAENYADATRPKYHEFVKAHKKQYPKLQPGKLKSAVNRLKKSETPAEIVG